MPRRATLYTIGSQSRTLKQWREILGDTLPKDMTIWARVNTYGMTFMEAITTPVSDRNGLSMHPLANVWYSLNDRCNNPSSSCYKNYGGEGVYVCEEWHENNSDGLQNFINDMEANYAEGYQLDKDIRAIPGKPKCYSKDTCCWVTHTENIQAASRTKLTKKQVKEIKQRLATGETQKNIAKDFNLNQSTISYINKNKTWKNINL